MLTLEQAFYSCISQNSSLLKVIHKYAVEGYFIWDRRDSETILLDARLAANFDIHSTLQVQINQLNSNHKNFVKTIITKIEQTISLTKLNSSNLECTIDDPIENAQIRFIVFCHQETKVEYILAIIQNGNPSFEITDYKTNKIDFETLALVPLNTLYSVIITDEKGRINFVNNSFERLSGFSYDEIIGKKPGHFLQGPQTDRKDIVDFSKNLASGKSFTQEIVNHTKSGKAYRVSCFIDPIYNEQGQLIKFISIQTDVTEKKRNQEYLATFKNTLDQTEDCVFIFDKDDFKFNYVNQGAINMMGYSEQELLELHPYDIKPEYPKEKFKPLVKPLIEGKKASIRFKTFHRTKEGLDIHVEVFLQFIKNENVSPNFVAIVKDISEQIKIENELKRLSLVAEKTNNLVVITNEKGKIEYVNPAFESKTGYNLDEVIGEKLGKFLHGKETNPMHIKANRAGLKTLKPFTQEILNYSKSGQKYRVAITFNPVFDEDGRLTNFIAIEKDITERIERENLLKESEERLQFVLKGSELGYWDWEADSGRMTVNNRWFEMLGYEPNEFYPSIENWHALVHPEDMTKLNEIMKSVFPDPTKGDFYVELRAKHKKGHYIWILDRGSVVKRNAQGEPLRISGMHMEISKRKLLEEELSFERQFLKNIMDTNALSILVINKEGKVIFANHGAENLLGLKKSTIEDMRYDDPYWNIISLDGDPFPSEKLPFMQVLTTNKATKNIEFGLKWHDQTEKYLSVIGAPLKIENGQTTEVVISIIDITKRIGTQKQLDAVNQEINNIVKDLTDVVWSVEIPSYKLTYITPSIQKLTGYYPKFYIGKTVQETWETQILKSDLPLLKEGYKSLEANEAFELEYRILTKEKKVKWILNKGKLITENGKPIRMDGYIADISHRKEQENELRKYLKIVEDQNERLRNFTYIVSHNLRSHSANIQGLMYLINKKHPKVAEIDYVKLLDKASNKLDDTLHHLNNVVSVVSSADEIKKVNLNDAVVSFTESFENLIKESGVRFINKVPKNQMVEAVPAFLESIITNLLTNSIKYCDQRKGDCYVKINSRKLIGIVVIEITDNGLGIDLDKYGDKLFGMYKTFHTHKDSRGLGLFLTKNQIESMGGKIEVQSKINEGSTFKVFLKDGSI
ncbi:PAS domain S-box protein [Marivirga sp.]|uniref:PAS domain-containing sensor histidine kinase n=1 Tax=Marivirga sp. TaxID=2018662 RepID=UPI002D80D86A|nr:PAS domain S-box protein [Marivirga sp.]HET8859667.1 PAS domain S-box protein [Marivirga sp.]